jgi:hypothetical protein
LVTVACTSALLRFEAITLLPDTPAAAAVALGAWASGSVW